MAEHNQRFAISAAQEGSAFVADTMGAWREILCIQEDRTVGNDNTVKWERLSLQLPPSRLRSHFVKATVRVHAYPDGRLAVFWGPHRLADYDARGSIIQRSSAPFRALPSSVRAEGAPPVDLWATPGSLTAMVPRTGLPTTPQAHHPQKQDGYCFMPMKIRRLLTQHDTLPYGNLCGGCIKEEQERSGR